MIVFIIIVVVFLFLPLSIITWATLYYSHQVSKATDSIYKAVSQNDVDEIDNILKSKKAKYIPEYTKLAMSLYVEGMRNLNKRK